MTDDGLARQAPAVFSSKERAALVAKALSEAARRARFSTKRRRGLTQTGFRARRSDRIFKLMRLATFVALVVLPALVTGIYYGLIASDQFVSEARFTVRGGMPPMMDKIGSLAGAPTGLIVQDTQVIMNFLQSRAVVESLDRTVGLRKLYGSRDIDWWSRLGRGKAIEKVTKYWTKHIDVSIAMPAGIVTFKVRAFSPDDAVKLADAALDASETLVNRMNDQMTGDAVALAEKERKFTQDKLARARVALERTRNQEGILSGTEATDSLTELMTDVKGQLIKLQQQYDTQRRFVQDDAPQVRNLAARIAAARRQIADIQDQMTSTGGAASPGDGGNILSGSMTRLDEADLENKIAEKIYAGSLTALEQAKLASETKLMYINVFVHPVAAQESSYPRRWLMVGLVTAIGAAVWTVVLGLLILARNRMA